MIALNKHQIGKHLYTAGRILLGAVFIYASWEKVFNPAAFAAIITNYQILPPSLVGPTALILPWVELICGISLILHRWVQGSALVVTGLMVVFIGAQGYNAYRGFDVVCGCFTLDASAPADFWRYLLRNTVLLAMAVYVLCDRPSEGHRPAAP